MKKTTATLAVVMFSSVLGLARIAPIVSVSLDANTPKGPIVSGTVNASLLRLDVFANANIHVNTASFRIEATGNAMIANLKIFCDGVQLGNIIANVIPGKSYAFSTDVTIPSRNTKVLEVWGDVGGKGTVKVTLTKASGVEIGNLAAITFPGQPVSGNGLIINRPAH
jgi:hypothetical protein